jgi:hypothetical protein
VSQVKTNLGAAIGTGKLVRMYGEKLPPEARLWGVCVINCWSPCLS